MRFVRTATGSGLRSGGFMVPALALLGLAVVVAPARAQEPGPQSASNEVEDRAPGVRSPAASLAVDRSAAASGDSADAAPKEPAPDLAASCLRSHEQAQILWNQGDLIASRRELLACSAVRCSPPVRGDCVRWYEQIKQSLPSIVLAAAYRGRDTSEVAVELNGKRAADRLGGRALDVNPGEHRLRFVHASGRVIERTIVIHEGEKNRIVKVEFEPTDSAKPAAESASASPVASEPERAAPVAKTSPLAMYVAGSVALVSAGVATFFGLSVLSDTRAARDAETGCSPFCADEEVGDLRTRAMVADISAVISVLAAADAIYLYVVTSGSENPPKASPQIPGSRTGLGLVLHGVF